MRDAIRMLSCAMYFVCLLAAMAVGPQASAAPAADKKQAEKSVKWVPMGTYVRQNQFWNLEIVDVQAKYDPFVHDDKDESKCGPSRITFTFTIKNTGHKPAVTPQHLLYEANMLKPWMVPESMVVKEPTPEEQAQLRSWIRVPKQTLKPGQSMKVSEWVGPPLGPWNPLRIEARLGQRGPFEATFLGKQEPFRRTIKLDAPDYYLIGGVIIPLGDKPLEQTRRFKMIEQASCSGQHLGGPVSVSVDVFGRGTDRIVMGARGSFEDTADFRYEAEVTSKAPIGDRVRVAIFAGCPKHKWAVNVVDANPANNQEIRPITRAGSSPNGRKEGDGEAKSTTAL